MLASLLRAAVGLVVETPIALAADVLTLGGACVERDEPYTTTALRRVVANVAQATEPNDD